MSDQQIKKVLDIITNGHVDSLIRTYVPTGKPAPDVDPLTPPPFEIGGPAGMPSSGNGKAESLGGAKPGNKSGTTK
jgi:hypothetical protein